ncbi:hypothetical protein ACFX2F_045580 [Malus domestica]
MSLPSLGLLSAPLSLFSTANARTQPSPLHEEDPSSSPSRPSPLLSRAATPGNPERNSGEFLFSRTKSKPGVGTPISDDFRENFRPNHGELAGVQVFGDLRGFRGHFRPNHGELYVV